MDNTELPKSDTPESDEAAWFDNDEGWWVSRSVSRRLERNWKSAELALAESKAGAAALREALTEIHWYELNRSAPDVTSGMLMRASNALSSTAGASLLARIAELESLVAGLEQDRDTLQWIEENMPVKITPGSGFGTGKPVPFVRIELSEDDSFRAPTLREAIDQARTAEIERRKA